MPLLLLYFIKLTNLYCAKTLNIVLSFVMDVHFVKVLLLVFPQMWWFPHPFGFCNPVRIYGRKINDDEKRASGWKLQLNIIQTLKCSTQIQILVTNAKNMTSINFWNKLFQDFTCHCIPLYLHFICVLYVSPRIWWITNVCPPSNFFTL